MITSHDWYDYIETQNKVYLNCYKLRYFQHFKRYPSLKYAAMPSLEIFCNEMLSLNTTVHYEIVINWIHILNRLSRNKFFIRNSASSKVKLKFFLNALNYAAYYVYFEHVNFFFHFETGSKNSPWIASKNWLTKTLLMETWFWFLIQHFIWVF